MPLGRKIVQRQIAQRAKISPHALRRRLIHLGLSMWTRHELAELQMPDRHIGADPAQPTADVTHVVV
jgi:hypothetical protein